MPVAAVTERFALVGSPVGELILTGDPGRLTGCWFRGPSLPTDPTVGRERDDDAFAPVAAQLAEYFAGTRTEFQVELAPTGTDFQLQVWAALRAIPYGETRSYADIARAVGRPSGFRAVGLANGRNPISIIVPCHRVIGADGSLTGYGGGIDRKRFLLDLERGALPFG